MTKNLDKKLKAFERILVIMDELRAQCPWDRKQTMETLRNLTIEETYELADAITEGDIKGVKEEIGDIFLHTIFYAKIGEEQYGFDIADTINDLAEKLIERHPHIYGDVQVDNEADVKKNWEEIKMKTGRKKLLSGVPNSLPAMVKAYRMQEKTAQVGFEWENRDQVFKKVEEEIGELHVAIESKSKDEIEEEFGDVLFSLINYSRFINVDPETALSKINHKFKTRFEYIEDHAPKSLSDMTLEEMDELWNEAKEKEKS